MRDVAEVQAGWQLDGQGARNHQRFLVPAMMDRGRNDLVEAVSVSPGERVLDLAAALAPHTDDDGIVVPFQMLRATASR